MKNLKAACLVLLVAGCTSSLDNQVPDSDVVDGGIGIEVTDGLDEVGIGDLWQNKDDVAGDVSDIPDIEPVDVPDSSDQIAPTEVIEVVDDTKDTSKPNADQIAL